MRRTPLTTTPRRQRVCVCVCVYESDVHCLAVRYCCVPGCQQSADREQAGRRTAALADVATSQRRPTASLHGTRDARSGLFFSRPRSHCCPHQGCSGAGGRRPSAFFDRGGRDPHFPHFFGLKFVQKLVHCCNCLLTETQCKIISVQQNLSDMYEYVYVGLNCLKNLCLSLVSGILPLLF